MTAKLTKQQVKKWNKEHKKIMDSINIGFVLCDPYYTCYEANDAYLEMVGAKREDYQGLSARDLYSPEEFDELYHLIEPIEILLKNSGSKERKKFYAYEYHVYHHQTGEKIPVQFSNAIVLNENGEHEATYVTVADLREQKRTQKALMREKNKLEAILFGIGDSVSVFSLDGDLITANPQGIEIHKNHPNPFLAFDTASNTDIEVEVLGARLNFEGKMKSIRDSEGQVFAYSEILQDITNQKKLEQKDYEISHMRREMRRMGLQSEMVGASHAMRNIFDLILRCAEVDSTILILGETGVGKELAARAIHNQSPRFKAPFIGVNCGALPETLLESELFGHLKGAFTGAMTERKGLFREAEGGTLFLDEIGDLSESLQVKLLRVLQEKEVRPIGSGKAFPFDVRVLAATHRDLKEMVDQDRYRQDLYYRLAVIPITIPNLRERKDDILLLAEHFIRKHSINGKRTNRKLDHASQQLLLNYSWPGNIRELENCIEHALAISKAKTISPSSLPVQVVHQPNSAAAPERTAPAKIITDRIDGYTSSVNAQGQPSIMLNLKPWELEERTAIEESLIKNKGRRDQTAKDLGISRSTLWRKMHTFQVKL